MDKRLISFLGILLLVAALVGGYFIMKKLQKPTLPPIQEEKSEGLGGELYEQGKNPAEDLPDTNPFQVETNPLEQVKTNPFEGVYKNPFQ